MTEKVVHFAALSAVALEVACEALQQQLGVGPFTGDTEDSWEYAWADTGGCFVNLTRTSDTSTIASWMPEAPDQVNWQVILRCNDEHQMSRIRQVLEAVIGAPLAAYHVA